MSTANKLTYLNGTKQLLKDKINNLGGSIDEHTTFRNYANQLQNVYDNLPKTEYQEGTEVNLGKTSKGKLDYDNGIVGIGQTEQDGTPTPSTPIEIKSVTGNQDVVVSTPIEITIIENLRASTISSGNNFFYADNNYIMRYFPIEKGKKYKVTWDYTSTETQINIYLFTENVPVVNGTYNTNDVTQINWRVTDNITFIADRDGYFVTAYSRFANTIIENFGAIQYETYQLSLGDIELNAIGNYKDELVYDVDNDKVYKKAYIDEKILTSSMCNGVTASASYGTLCYLSFNGMVDNNVVCAMSNKFVGVSYNDRTSLPTGYRIFTSDGAGGVTLRFPNTSDIDTLQEAKDFVDNNAITVYYVLATPTLTEITDTTLKAQVKAWYNARSLNGTTIITSNGDLPMIIKVRALKGE